MKFRNRTFAGLYEEVLSQVYTSYDNIIKPRGLEVKECTNMVLELTNPYSNLFKNPVRSVPMKYLCAELYWYFTGRRDTNFISRYAPFWKTISTTDGFGKEIANSAYGYMLFERNKPFCTEWEWAYESLLADSDTRQAIMHFNTPTYFVRNTKDFPCTLSATFQIRNNKLNLTVVMRSQDVMKGLTYDLPFFTLLQQNMHLCLLQTEFEQFKRKYSRLVLGSLTIFAESEHIYATDFLKARQMLLSTFSEDRLPVMQVPLYNDDHYRLLQGFEGDKLCELILKNIELPIQKPVMELKA